MKITKSELKEMIREALREELAKASLTEGGVMRGGDAQNGALDTYKRPGGSTQPDHKSYLGRLKNKNPDLVDTMTVKGKDIKPGMITQAGQVKEADVRKNNRGETKVYIMHTNDYDGFWDVDEDMIVMVDPENKTKPFTGKYQDLLKMGLKESAPSDTVLEDELEDELEEGIFGNKYKGTDILVYRGDGKDEALAIASKSANNYNLLNFKKAHAKKNNHDESDYVLVSATDMAIKKYKKALKAAPDVTSNLPQWVKQYVNDTKAQNARDFKNAELTKEREAEAARKARMNNKSSSDDSNNDYEYVKGNGYGTYKYKVRESVTESLNVDNVFENLY